MRSLSNLTAFVVDDDEVELFLAQRILLLKKLAGEVKTFRTGESFVKAFDENATLPHYVLLNFRMHGENGLDILNLIKNSIKPNRMLPHFILTSSTLDLHDLNIIKSDHNIDGFITKPIIPHNLSKILYELLSP